MILAAEKMEHLQSRLARGSWWGVMHSERGRRENVDILLGVENKILTEIAKRRVGAVGVRYFPHASFDV